MMKMIQKNLFQFFFQAKSSEVLQALAEASDDRDLENRLVLLLGYDCFEFVKVLNKNRYMSKFFKLHPTMHFK